MRSRTEHHFGLAVWHGHSVICRAGKDAARAFGTGCFQTHQTHDLRGLTESELRVSHVGCFCRRCSHRRSLTSPATMPTANLPCFSCLLVCLAVDRASTTGRVSSKITRAITRSGASSTHLSTPRARFRSIVIRRRQRRMIRSGMGRRRRRNLRGPRVVQSPAVVLGVTVVRRRHRRKRRSGRSCERVERSNDVRVTVEAPERRCLWRIRPRGATDRG